MLDSNAEKLSKKNVPRSHDSLRHQLLSDVALPTEAESEAESKDEGEHWHLAREDQESDSPPKPRAGDENFEAKSSGDHSVYNLQHFAQHKPQNFLSLHCVGNR
jgi:hypothetical protein